MRQALCGDSSTPIITLIIAVLVVSIPGCRKDQFHIQEKFVNLYVELRLATLGNQSNEKRAAESRRIIMANYGIKPEEFNQYMEEIIKRPEVWIEFQNKVLESLKEMEKNHKGE